MEVLKPRKTAEQLPPDDEQYYVVRYSGKGSWHEDEVDQLQGKVIKANKDSIKVWYEPVEE